MYYRKWSNIESDDEKRLIETGTYLKGCQIGARGPPCMSGFRAYEIIVDFRDGCITYPKHLSGTSCLSE